MQGEEESTLFIGTVPRSASEDDLRTVFATYGQIEDINILRDKMTSISKGCAFVRFTSKEEASAAIENLNGICMLENSTEPIIVKFAESRARKGYGSYPGVATTTVQETTLFIGSVPKTASEDSLRGYFSAYGNIELVNILRDKITGESKACAFIRYSDRDACVAAIDALNGVLTLEGSVTPIIVKFAEQKIRHPYHMGGMRQIPQWQYGGAGYGVVAPQWAQAQQWVAPHWHQPQHWPPAAGAAPFSPPAFEYNDGNKIHKQDGPPGCNLFIYHIPATFTDPDLFATFQPFGTVTSAKIFCDRISGMSKGFGFVSYDNPQSAEAAIGQMNGFQIGNKRLKVQHKKMSAPVHV